MALALSRTFTVQRPVCRRIVLESLPCVCYAIVNLMIAAQDAEKEKRNE